MHFIAICRPKFKKFVRRCLPWAHPTESESLGKTAVQKSAWIKACQVVRHLFDSDDNYGEFFRTYITSCYQVIYRDFITVWKQVLLRLEESLHSGFISSRFCYQIMVAKKFNLELNFKTESCAANVFNPMRLIMRYFTI